MSVAVSLLIPVHNAAGTLEATLSSALTQTHRPLEILALDDGSTDGSCAVLRRYADRIRIVRQDNRGGGAARNRLMDMSSAPYVQFLDADDLIDPPKIARQLAVALAAPGAAAILDTMRLFHGDPDDEFGLFRPDGEDWWTHLINARIPFTSAALWRRDAILAVGGWDETLASGQEYDLYFRLLKSGRRLAHVDLAMTRYRLPPRDGRPKRDPAVTIAERLAALERIEAHLAATGTLTPARTLALADQRLRLARRLWPIDRPAACRLADRVQPREVARLAAHDALPRRYLAALTTVGFPAAERLAGLLRALP